MAKIATELQELVGLFRMSGSLDLSAAKTAHLAWRAKLRRFLDGKGDIGEDEAVCHTECALGKWYYAGGAAERYGNIQEMAEIEDPHKEMHELVREILDLKRSGKEQDAEQAYTKVGPLSKHIVSMLDQIERQLADA